MPKAEKGSVKDIAKRIKAKGLQKLKFYCQLCEKQCRDANGFKCHITSESHLRQVKIFSGNAQKRMDQYSREFEKTFLDTLRRRHGTKQVPANHVYQQVIHDKQHIHMNATIWATLTDFCKYLGKKGKCIVEETERGWMISYIEHDLGKLEQQEAAIRRKEAEQEAEAALQERIERQRQEAARSLDPSALEATQATALNASIAAPVKLAIKSKPNSKANEATMKAPAIFGEEDSEGEDNVESDQIAPDLPPIQDSKRKRKRENEDTKPEKRTKQSQTWLYKDIMVRIIHKELEGGKYFKRKAVVDKVLGQEAEVTVLDSGPNQRDGGDILQIHQKDLETVVPKSTGKLVRIVKGPWAGDFARVIELDKKRFRAVLELESSGRIVNHIDFDDFSKQA